MVLVSILMLPMELLAATEMLALKLILAKTEFVLDLTLFLALQRTVPMLELVTLPTDNAPGPTWPMVLLAMITMLVPKLIPAKMESVLVLTLLLALLSDNATLLVLVILLPVPALLLLLPMVPLAMMAMLVLKLMLAKTESALELTPRPVDLLVNVLKLLTATQPLETVLFLQRPMVLSVPQ